jgi:hypothetical protein
MAERSAEEKAIEELRKEIKNMNTGRNYLTGNESFLTTLIKDLAGPAEQSIKSIASLAEKSMENTAGVADVVDSVKQVLGSLGPGGRIAGESLGFFANILTSSVDNWQKFSHEGLNFAGNAMAFREAVMKTGMSFQDFGDTLDKIKPSLFQLGGGISGGLHAFGEISKIMNDPQMQIAFNTMGMLPKEANEVLALTIKLGRANNINQDEAGRQRLADSTLKLSIEMDAMAKLTGISRREQEKNIETIANDARVRARMSQLMNDPEKREGIGNIMANAKTLPPEVAKAFAESIAGKGIMTSDKLADLNLTYGATVAQQFEKIGRLSDGTAEDQAEAARLTKELLPLMVEGKRQMAQYVQYQSNDTAMGREAHTNEAMFNYENTIADLMKTKANGEKRLSYDDAKKEAEIRAKALSEGKLIEDVMVRVGKEMVLIKAEKVDGQYVSVDPRKYATQIATTAGSISRGLAQELNAGLLDVNDKMLEMERFTDEHGVERLKYTKESLEVIKLANGASVGPDGKPKNTGNVLGEKFVGFIKDNTQALVDLPTGIANAFRSIAGSMGVNMTPNKPNAENEIKEQIEKDKKNKQNNGTNVSAISPNLTTVLTRDLPTAVAAVQTSNESVVALTEKLPDSNLMTQQLEKISIIMANVETTMKEANGISKKIADNTFGMSGYVA